MKKHVLIVENDQFLAETYAYALAHDFTVSIAKDAQTAIDIVDNSKVDTVVIDIMLGSHNGIEVIHEIKSYDDWGEVPIVILSSIPISEFPLSADDWRHYGISKLCYKPRTSPKQLHEAVKGILAAA